MAKIDLVDDKWCDLVFEGRNQAYGAYIERRTTGIRNIKALVILLLILGAALAGLAAWNAYQEYQAAHAFIDVEAELSALNEKKEPKVEKKAPVKLDTPVEKIEKVKSSVKFVAPVIKEEVPEEEEMKSQEDLNKTNTAIGAFDVKGNDEAAGEVLKAKQEIAQPEEKVEEKVFDVVEQMPEFPGGMAALMQYLGKNIKYPPIAEENGVQGRVIVTFVVERNGSITDVQVAKSVDPHLDKEAVRVVSSMPKWIPGKQNGAPVRVKYTVPVTFRLQ